MNEVSKKLEVEVHRRVGVDVSSVWSRLRKKRERRKEVGGRRRRMEVAARVDKAVVRGNKVSREVGLTWFEKEEELIEVWVYCWMNC